MRARRLRQDLTLQVKQGNFLPVDLDAFDRLLTHLISRGDLDEFAPPGQPSEPGPYTIRVKAPHGEKLMPHKHPEDRVYTVIPGVFYIPDWVTNSTRVSWKPIRRGP